VLHGTSTSVPKKIIFFSDPHDLTNYKQGNFYFAGSTRTKANNYTYLALSVLDHSYHVHMIQFTSNKREDQLIEDARRLCGTTAGGFYLHRANKDGYKAVREAINGICSAECTVKCFQALVIDVFLS
jgi:hypothetical protein